MTEPLNRTAINLTLTVNGHPYSLQVPADATLLDVLREDLQLTGTKYNCRQGECGACTVIVDGYSVCSCIALAASADGAEITTVEGLSEDGGPDVVQQAFSEADGSQCGYCTPGMVMSATALLMRNPNPTETEIRGGLEGNLCRCTGYKHIVEAVEIAAERLRSKTDRE